MSDNENENFDVHEDHDEFDAPKNLNRVKDRGVNISFSILIAAELLLGLDAILTYYDSGYILKTLLSFTG